jgi:hypothetical protein
VTASFSERIHRIGDDSERNKREERGGARGGFIGEVDLEQGLGFRAVSGSDDAQWCCARAGLRPELGDEPDMRARHVSGRRGPAYPFGRRRCWAAGRFWG